LKPPPSLRAQVPALSSAIEYVILTALAKDPKARFATMRAFATAFLQACQPESAAQQAIMPSDAEATLHFSSVSPLHPVQLLDAGGDALHLPVLSDEYTTHQLPPEGDLPTEGNAQTPLHEDENATLPLPGVSEHPGKRLSRRMVLAGLAGLAIAGGGLTWLISSRKAHPAGLQNIRTPALTPTPGNQTPVLTPTALPGTTLNIYRGGSTPTALTFSPTSLSIAIGGLDGVVVWPLFGGGASSPYQNNTGAVYAVAWSPDGRYIASGGDAQRVSVWNPVSFIQLTDYAGQIGQIGNIVTAVAWSPDSQKIASEVSLREFMFGKQRVGKPC
jgi:hypothetical protein